jgi:hypothetical protein
MIATFLDNLSIEARLHLINLVTMGSAFVLAASLLVPQRISAEEHKLLTDARQKSMLVARNSTAALEFQNAKAAAEMLASLDVSRNVTEAALWTADDVLLATYTGCRRYPAGRVARGRGNRTPVDLDRARARRTGSP